MHTQALKDNSKRSKDITLVFIIAICIELISIITLIYQSYVLDNYNMTNEEMSTIEILDIVVPIIGLAQLGIFIISAVFFLRWFKRAYGNLIIKNQPTEHTEAGAVWGFIIPIISLFRPITTAKEVYLKTQYAIKEYNSSFKIDNDTSFIVIWWLAYIVTNVASSIVSRIYDNAYDISGLVEANGYMIISEAINILGLLLALYVINKITKVETILKNTNEWVSEIDEIGKPIE